MTGIAGVLAIAGFIVGFGVVLFVLFTRWR
jgi:hypothetical protein